MPPHDLKTKIIVAATAAFGLAGCARQAEAPAIRNETPTAASAEAVPSEPAAAPAASVPATSADAPTPEPSADEAMPLEERSEPEGAATPTDGVADSVDDDAPRRGRRRTARQVMVPQAQPSSPSGAGAASCGASCGGASCGGEPGDQE